MLIWSLVAMAALAGGCYDEKPTEKDVTAANAKAGGVSPDRDYELVQDLYVYRDGSSGLGVNKPGEPARVGSGSENPRTPPLEEYQKTPEKWPWIVGVAVRDSRVHVSRVTELHMLPGTFMYSFGRITGGGHDFDEVDLSRIVVYDSSGTHLVPNSDFLREVQPQTGPAIGK
jgi:hypothetical protein